jgi:hypothetical protein
MEHDLPEIVSQALAYYAASYLDVSTILPCKDSVIYTQPVDYELVNKILFDLVRADQRFDGKIEGQHNTLQSSMKLLLKSQFGLLSTYMKTWSTYACSASDKLDMLVYTAMTLIKVSSHQVLDNGPIELDWFLAGGQLLESALAIKYVMTDDEHLENWVDIQFLSTLCTFVVQGRPMNTKTKIDTTINIQDTILAHASDDSKLILTVSCVLKVQELYPQYQTLCSEVLQLLSQFAMNGTWIKTGLGWQ